MVYRSEKDKALRSQMVNLLPRMRRFALSLTGNPDRADDLVQQACERALTRFHQLKEGARMDSWLYRIIYTRWIDTIRRINTRSANLKSFAMKPEPLTRPEPQTDRMAEMMDLRESLCAIPEKNRAALSLICIEGLSYAEASTVLNVPPGTVASRVARARAMLVNRMNKPSAKVVTLPMARP